MELTDTINPVTAKAASAKATRGKGGAKGKRLADFRESRQAGQQSQDQEHDKQPFVLQWT